MNNISRKIFLGSLTSLSVMATSVAFAQEMVTAPSFEGGVTASIGTFYVVPSSDDNEYLIVSDDEKTNSVQVLNAEADYDFGFEATLGYLFEDTANGIELAYRNLNTDDTSDPKSGSVIEDDFFTTFDDVKDTISYELNALDLMISQYMDIGTHMQMRFSGGLSYVELEQEEHITGTAHTELIGNNNAPAEGTATISGKNKSEFRGLGPRLGVDARYDFGEDLEGFGIVGGASAAYFLGETDLTATLVTESSDPKTTATTTDSVSEDIDNHAVTNLRANLGIDYVYFFDNEELSTLGLELGYMVDWYDDAISSFNGEINNGLFNNTAITATSTSPVAFSGPYLNLKGVF